MPDEAGGPVLRIPHAPDVLALRVERDVSGGPGDPALSAIVSLQAGPTALRFSASVSAPEPPRVPDEPGGSRVDGLWEYDVVELFLVGEDGRYLEVELGADGHYLVLGFDAPRRRCDEHWDLETAPLAERSEGGWAVSLSIPWARVPSPLAALNAFLCVGGRFLAYAPLPGDVPDFHQPDHYPAATLD